MPIDKNLIQEKLQKISEYIKRIETMDFSEDQFLENVDYQDLALVVQTVDKFSL